MTTPIEPVLSFLEGLALIASPCILPVLPMVLSASVDGGRKRPFGIIIGFSLAFSLFAFASRKLVNVLGIEPSVIQHVSLVLLAVFGLVLLSEKLSDKFSLITQGAADLGSKFGSGSEGGLFGGIAIGALIGLIWTPCAGPILAAVLVQVIRQKSDLQSLIIIVPFAVGAGVPMLIISLMGRKVMSKLGFFTRHAEGVRKVFGVIILLSVAFIASGVDVQSLFNSVPQTVEEPAAPSSPNTKDSKDKQVVTSLQKGLEQPYPAPEFADIQGWINSDPLTMASLKGKVVLVDFWTYSCINCIRTLPHITMWDAKYRDKGLVIIGVHSPEFEFEKNIDNVKAAVLARGIHYPVALDSNLGTWSNFQNQYWPGHYLIDRDGKVVYTHFGEGDYDITENNIRYLLGLKDAVVDDMQADTPSGVGQTHETYLGYARAQNYAGKMPEQHDVTDSYHFPENLPANNWALQGKWKVAGEMITAEDADSALRLNFTARKVFLVLGSDHPMKTTILLNGQPVGDAAGQDVKDGVVMVNGRTLYELVNQPASQPGLLEIQTTEPGLEAYAFTFGG